MNKFKKILKKEKEYVYRIAVKDFPNSNYAESFRKIPLNLKYINVDNEPKVIQITSSNASEHKTSTSLNLAAVYSELGKKVLLIDCDLRRPKVHRAFNIVNLEGLSNYLVGSIEFENLVVKTEYGFDFIPAGESVPFPHVVLRSEKFRNLIELLREKYDYIIIDTPPVLLVTDSLIISGLVDATVFVINQKTSLKTEVKESLGLLKDSNAKIAGVILSNVDKRISSYGNYKGY